MGHSEICHRSSLSRDAKGMCCAAFLLKLPNPMYDLHNVAPV